MPEQPIIRFATAAAFRRWLGLHHAEHPGIWMRIGRKGTPYPGITYPQALDEALCFGWIDGQRQRGDDATYLQKFTRRRPRSLWSKVNIAHVERLVATDRMHPAGLAEVAAARTDGRWAQAYDSFRTAVVPDDFLRALARVPKARAFFATLNKSNHYAIYHRLHTARRPETRERRINEFVAMLARGEKLHG